MKMKKNKTVLLITLFFCLFINACSDKIAGTGTETSTGEVVALNGVVKHEGVVVAHAKVYLLPKDSIFKPDQVLEAGSVQRTNEKGEFSLLAKKGLRYHLQAEKNSGEKVLLNSIQPEFIHKDSVIDLEVKETSTLTFKFPKEKFSSSTKGFIALSGTLISIPYAGEDSVTLQSVPYGLSPELVYIEDQSKTELLDSLNIQPGETKNIDYSEFNAWSGVGQNLTVSTFEELSSQYKNLLPGDTLTIKEGIYQVNGFPFNTSGFKESPILIRGEEGTVLRSRNKYDNVFNFYGVSYITVENVVFDSTPLHVDAIKIKEEYSSNITIKNCTFKNIGGVAINVNGPHEKITITENVIYSDNGNSDIGIRIGNSEGEENLSEIIIEKNEIHSLTKIDEDHPAAIHIHQELKSSIVSGNRIYNVQGNGIVYKPIASKFTVLDASDLLIQNNALYDIDEAMAVYHNALIKNNILINSPILLDVRRINGDLDEFIFRHNTLYNGAVQISGLSESAKNKIHFNLFFLNSYSFDLNQRAGFENNIGDKDVFSKNETLVNCFQDSENLNFYLKESCQAVDYQMLLGDGSEERLDYQGVVRDSLPDLGALEFKKGNPGFSINEKE